MKLLPANRHNLISFQRKAVYRHCTQSTIKRVKITQYYCSYKIMTIIFEAELAKKHITPVDSIK